MPREEGGAEFGFSVPAYPDELDPVIEDAPSKAQESSVTQMTATA
jgi:hypothetical protein